MKKKNKVIALILSFILLLTSCSLPGLGEDAKNDGIVIAGGNTSERQILAEIVKQMIEHDMDDTNVSIMNNLGSSMLIHQAMSNKDINVSGSMYTGTSLTGELGEEPIKDPEKALEAVIDGYKTRFHRKWYPSYGFGNTYAFMVTREFAEKENIKTVSDLERLAPELRAGVDTSWMERKGDGYEAFKEIYKFDFEKVYPMEIGLVYSAVNAGEMDVVLGYSTDGRIDTYDLVVLEDDKRLFPPYDVSPVANEDILEVYPKLDEVLLKLKDTISNEDMQRMNRRSDEDLIEPKNVAKEFLEKNNYFDNKEVK
ncbi:MAG: osmoprotectant ABC transporter substrate-binding protein [Tissierellia bacterium]|nr:osmoprotectant ABC transporter substrate-binding protein [Tissierellia bacterium]